MGVVGIVMPSPCSTRMHIILQVLHARITTDNSCRTALTIPFACRLEHDNDRSTFRSCAGQDCCATTAAPARARRHDDHGLRCLIRLHNPHGFHVYADIHTVASSKPAATASSQEPRQRDGRCDAYFLLTPTCDPQCSTPRTYPAIIGMMSAGVVVHTYIVPNLRSVAFAMFAARRPKKYTIVNLELRAKTRKPPHICG